MRADFGASSVPERRGRRIAAGNGSFDVLTPSPRPAADITDMRHQAPRSKMATYSGYPGHHTTLQAAATGRSWDCAEGQLPARGPWPPGSSCSAAESGARRHQDPAPACRGNAWSPAACRRSTGRRPMLAIGRNRRAVQRQNGGNELDRKPRTHLVRLRGHADLPAGFNISAGRLDIKVKDYINGSARSHHHTLYRTVTILCGLVRRDAAGSLGFRPGSAIDTPNTGACGQARINASYRTDLETCMENMGGRPGRRGTYPTGRPSRPGTPT